MGAVLTFEELSQLYVIVLLELVCQNLIPVIAQINHTIYPFITFHLLRVKVYHKRLDFSTLFAYTMAMKISKIYISRSACRPLIEYLTQKGCELVFAKKAVNSHIGCHPDILYCHLGGGKVFHGDSRALGPVYPADCIYNACSTGKYFIHNLNVTDSALLKEADKMGLKKIHVSQGYARCSALSIDKNSVITYDRGIARACRHQGGPEVLLVQPGHVLLPGYGSGFIGGCGGCVGNEIVFNGDLSAHPDFEAINDFIGKRGLRLVYFKGEPLTDIGSVIEEVL